ncbi:hypothetical protein PRIP_10357 [Listeria riparia FSL S10-1204]|uniref:YncI copper-binding domain-containing protein n=1 Tax=Listeria riparia FSL S10-1204 TaxID=1265816 RepID=W7D9Y4_9LIST|nr:hypothetical protein PRIP_10357 [Listeria riparia FSL S10-1204]
MKKVITSLVGILFLVAMPVIASAHVTVAPTESTTGAWETYTVKVPVEKASATTKLVVKMPAGVEFQSYEPVPGWNVMVNKDNGTVTWTATGSGILNGQFQRFSFVAQNPEKSGSVNWGCVSVLCGRLDCGMDGRCFGRLSALDNDTFKGYIGECNGFPR